MNELRMTRDGVKKRCTVCCELVPLEKMQKKKSGSYGTSGICKKCASEYQKNWSRKNIKELEANENDKRHGTYYGYSMGCRCDRCKDALRNYMKDYRRRQKNGNQG